jgi:hypothetical protein
VPYDVSHPAFAKGQKVAAADIAALFGMAEDFDNKHAIINIDPGHAIACVILQSRRRDTVLVSIMKKLAGDAKKQLTRKRPAIFCVHMSDLTSDQLVDIHNDGANGVFRREINAVMDRRPWLHTVAITATGSINVERERLNGPILALGLRDASMLCQSLAHPQASNPEVLRIFSDQN